jgi:hypothetical protein
VTAGIVVKAVKSVVIITVVVVATGVVAATAEAVAAVEEIAGTGTKFSNFQIVINVTA